MVLTALLSFGLAVNIYTDLRGYRGGLFDLGNTIFPLDLSLISADLSYVSFVRYNLPDGLWMLSLCLFLIAIWGNRSSVLAWLFLGLAMGVSLEILQYFGIIAGTFDMVDILFYVIALVVALIIHNSLNYDKWKTLRYFQADQKGGIAKMI
jgi:hypothetical protein